MLHIILAILKILGILLAALLLLLLLAVFSVLFVPLRYHLTAKKDTESVRVKGKLTWLLRLIAVSGGYQDAKPYLEFRILFLKKKLLPAEKKDIGKPPKRKTEKPKRRGKPERTTPAARESLPGTDGKHSSGQENRPVRPEKKLPAYNPGEQKEQRQTDETEIRGQKSWFGRILEKLSDIWKSILKTAQNTLEVLKSIPQRIGAFWKKLKKIFQKAGDFIGLLRSELVKTVFSHFGRHLKYLWKHLRPDRIQGELRYGFSDPAVTGQLTGILYLLLPGNCYTVRLEPDFENVIYEGEIHIHGHIRFWHFARVAWKVFRDKEFRTLYRKFASGSLSA